MTINVNDCFFYIKNGANIKQGVISGGIPITRIETLANDTFNRDKMGYAGIHDKKKYTEYILQDGDILMSHINSMAYLGRAVMYKMQKNECIIHGMNLLRLKANRNFILPEYAEYYFKSNTFKKYIKKIAKKSVNQASFSIADLKSIPLFLPNMVEQKKIYNTLNRIDNIISLKNQQLKKLDLLTKSLFIEMFGDPKTNPKEWRKIPLLQIISKANNGMARRGNDENGSIVLRLVELQEGIIDYSKPNRILLTEKEKEKYLLQENDFLFARVNGNPLNVGRCAVFHSIGEAVYHNDHIIRVHFDDSMVNGVFASTILNSEYGKDEMRNKIKTSAGQYTISQDGIGAIKTIVPPIDLQNQFADFVAQVDKHKSVVQKSLDETQLLFDSLMQKYFG